MNSEFYAAKTWLSDSSVEHLFFVFVFVLFVDTLVYSILIDSH